MPKGAVFKKKVGNLCFNVIKNIFFDKKFVKDIKLVELFEKKKKFDNFKKLSKIYDRIFTSFYH